MNVIYRRQQVILQLENKSADLIYSEDTTASGEITLFQKVMDTVRNSPATVMSMLTELARTLFLIELSP